MAIFKIQAEKDATIYSLYPTLNTGIDEILELRASAETGQSRILIQFPKEQVSYIFSQIPVNKTYKSYLNLYLADADEIPNRYKVFCDPIPVFWDHGLGRYNNTPQTIAGTSWNNINIPINSASQEIQYGGHGNLRIDVTNIVTNEFGFILTLEDVPNLNTVLKYFSKETHTIYQPQLDILWDDYSEVITNPNLGDIDLIFILSNNKGIYRQDEQTIFNIHVRDIFPKRRFQTTSIYEDKKVIKDVCWGLKDLGTNNMVIDFDLNYTKLSSNANGNYFKMFMNGLEPERHYQMMFKLQNQNNIKIYESDSFKIVK